MDQCLVTEWLRKRARRQAMLNLLGGILILLGGAVVLALTWLLTYVVSLFALGGWVGFTSWIHTILAWTFLPLLFWGNARTSREYLSQYSVTVGTSFQRVVNFHLIGVGMVSNINPLAPDTIHTGVKIITDWLYAGPRLVVGGFGMLLKAKRIRQLDPKSCGAVLGVLFAAPGKLSFQEIVDRTGSIDPTRVFPQLHEIDGVLFLQAEPAGLTLSQELRAEMRSIGQ